MPALAGLLIVVGYRTFNVDRVRQVWQTGSTQATVMATTFGPEPGKYPTESEPPSTVLAGETVVLAVHGSLFYASAPVFEQQLPDMEPHAVGGAVVLVLRGRDDLGSTFLQALVR